MRRRANQVPGLPYAILKYKFDLGLFMEYNLDLKLFKDCGCMFLYWSSSIFHALVVAGKKEFLYDVSLQDICLLFSSRRMLYLTEEEVKGGKRLYKYGGTRPLQILKY